MAGPAVVVIAYNRPVSLARLLRSLDAAAYPTAGEVPLVISIDRGDGAGWRETLRLAREFDWRQGPLRVIEQPRRLGLVEHYFACGRLSADLGDVVILEDDLVAGRAFHAFAAAALERYGDEPRVAGVCLYGLWFNGFTHLPFFPLEDASDVFFARVPYLQGQVFTPAQWQAFEAWREQHPVVGERPGLHPAFARFGPDEWLQYLAAYLADAGRYLCFPRVSHLAGWGERGTHFGRATSWMQTPLALRPRAYALPGLDQSLAVYDAFYEVQPEVIKRLAPGLPDAFDLDLNGTKRRVDMRTEAVITSRPVRRPLRCWGLDLAPPELNLVEGVPGEGLSLARVEDVVWDEWGALAARRRLRAFSRARYRPSHRQWLRLAVAGARERLFRLRDG